MIQVQDKDMSHDLYGVYGASGYGREVMPILKEYLASQNLSNATTVFIDDGFPGASINDIRVTDYEAFLALPASKRFVVVAIANSKVREMLSQRCLDDKVELLSLVAGNVVVMDDVRVGKGSILSPFVTITSNVCIGVSFHANIYSYVAHDCQIGNYVTFAPGVKCNGNVVVEDHAYIGTGAIIRQGEPGKPTVIGAGAVVGMGAVVTKSVLPGTTVVGNPARVLERRV